MGVKGAESALADKLVGSLRAVVCWTEEVCGIVVGAIRGEAGDVVQEWVVLGRWVGGCC